MKALTRVTRGTRSRVGVVVLGIVIVAWGSFALLGVLYPRYSVEAVIVYDKDVPETSVENTHLAWPDYGQSALATRDLGVVEVHGQQDVYPTASTAKLITILAVLEKKPLNIGEQGPILTLTQADVDLHAAYIARNGSNTAVRVGQQISQYQAIQSVLLASSNNMADSLAIWAFGSLAAYHSYASEMVQTLGASKTTLSIDASGLSPATTSTARDLAVIALAALKNPVIAEVVAQQTADVPVAGMIQNTNYLLRTTNDTVGVKTGETVEAGGNFILATNYTVEGQTQLVVTVVMGASTARTAIAASYELYQSAKTHLAYVQLAKKGQRIATYTLPGGEVRQAVALDSLHAWSWNGALPQDEVTMTLLTHATEDCSKVGSLRFGVQQTSVLLSTGASSRLPCQL